MSTQGSSSSTNNGSSIANNAAQQVEGPSTEMLRSIVEEHNSVSTEIDRLYADVIRIAAPRSDDTQRIEDDGPTISPSQWLTFLVERTERLVQYTHRLWGFMSNENRSTLIEQSASQGPLSALRPPVARHDATDSTRVQLPQHAGILTLFDQARFAQGMIAHIVQANTLSMERYDSDSRRSAHSAAVAALPKVAVNSSMVGDDLECSICKEKLELGLMVTKLPCDHVYHGTCINVWLDISERCPYCRAAIGPER